jgi:hypothetical protein
LAGKFVRPDGSFFEYSDLDEDGIPNADDACYLDPEAGGWSDWPFPGSHPVSADQDGDDVIDECDACPTTGTAWEWVDSDADGLADGCDNCPWTSNASQSDIDFDRIGDACDLCIESGARHRDRDETVLDGLPSEYDADGDGVGDRCDPCPRHDWNRGAWPLEPGWPADFLRAVQSVDPADILDGLSASWDGDGDGVGDACDNCRDGFNPDQANCNEIDERGRWLGGWPPGSVHDFRGTGDACDATPCIAECARFIGLAPSLAPGPDVCDPPRDCTDLGFGGRHCFVDCRENSQPTKTSICQVGYPESGRAVDDDPVHGDETAPYGHSRVGSEDTLRLATEM